ncbi:hypothetical protein TYRP_021760 [Tyrophagus putrescentiae]|nr:hypothetical protein TYRP_021760 [Tyrophagus putrescentiae]
MAFMVPLVKNHYDIYARNNPADHHNNGNNGGTNTGITGKSGNLVHDPASNSLILSATSLGKSGAPVKKQYRIILSGGQVVTNGNGKMEVKRRSPEVPGPTLSPPTARPTTECLQRASAFRSTVEDLDLVDLGAPRRSSKSTSEAGGAGSVRSTPTSPEHRSNSSNGSSPGSPPHYPSSRPPHSSASICQQPTSGSFRRTSAGVRSPQSGGNRLYSYSVSIPEDEEKKVKESLNSLLADKENLDQESQLEDDHQLLAIFATSAPGGTGALEEASLVKPPPSLKLMKKKMAKKPLVQKSASLNAASPPPLVEAKVHHHSISPPASPTSSPTSSPPASPSPSPSPSPPPPITTTSREYVELLRKFILHLKMLKIGSSSSNNNNNSSSKQRKQSKKSSVKSVKSNGVEKESELSAVAAVDDSVEGCSSEVSSEDSTSAPKRARKRKDTMEDSKDL